MWEAFLDERWLSLVLARLTNYANQRLRRYPETFCRQAGEPMDHALWAVEKVILGLRIPGPHVTDRRLLEGFLFDVVASMLNNEFRAFLRKVGALGRPESLDDPLTELRLPAAKLGGPPSAAVLDLFDRFRDAPELAEVLEAYLDGATSPQDVAFVLDIEVREAHNRMKLIRRRLAGEEECGGREDSDQP